MAPRSETGHRLWETIALLAIILLALGLRFHRLDAQSFWNDEGTSVALAQRDLPTITRNAANDIHPPLYYYLLRGWMILFGRATPAGGEFVARSLSALLGAALVVGSYALARRLWGGRVALLAAFFSSLSPFQIYYSQEARMYIVVALWGLLSMLALENLLRRWGEQGRAGSTAWAMLYLGAIVAALYTQYYALSLLLAQNLVFLLWLAWRWRNDPPDCRQPLGQWVLLQLAVMLVFAPWLWLARSSLRSWPAVSAPLSWSALVAHIARVFALGITVAEQRQQSLWGLALGLLLIPALIADLRHVGKRGAEPASPKVAARTEAIHGAVLVWSYLMVPIAVMYVLSLQRPMYKPKFLLLATPPYYLLQARGLITLADWLGKGAQRRWLSSAVAILLALLVCVGPVISLWRLYLDPQYARDDYRGIVAHIQSTASRGDAILINAPTQIETVGYYYRGPLEIYPLPQQRPIDTERTRATLAQMVSKHRKIYAIYWATDESDPQRFIETWLDRHCYKAMDSWYGNVRLVVYAVPLAASEDIEHATQYTLGQGIRLRGYTLLTPQPHSADILQLTLFWEAVQPVSARYKVFCHLVDGTGRIVGQRDSEPGGGLNLTSDWPPGQTIADNYGILIPADTPPGEYLLRVGMYGLDDGKRLPVSVEGRNVGDSIDLETITISH